MNSALKAGEAVRLADLLPYEEGSIVNMDIASNDAMKFVLMAFDEGTSLSPHRAPGDALIFALEGQAVIGYEGAEHVLRAGENFRFAKNGLHSVKADGRFKMALLITLR
ncbi:MAG: cupin domain-containing protein [Desulfovibrionaceae bacterium]|nr:cupin domain-containing protein [Desulfovibrionaceae bacterium]